MTSTAISIAAVSVIAGTAILLGVLLVMAAREDRLKAEHARLRRRK